MKMYRPNPLKVGIAACTVGLCCLSPLAHGEIVKNAAPLPVLKTGDWEALKIVVKKSEKEGTEWGNAIGNGFFGAKIKGGVETEIFQLNDKYFWSDWPRDTEDPKRKTAMEDTRRKLAEGDIPGANQSARGMWGSQDVGSYMPIGKLYVDFDGQKESDAKNYERALDLDRALSTVRYSLNGVNYTREAFASFPDKVMVMRVSADKKGKMTFTARLAYPPQMEGNASVEGSTAGLVMKGKAPAADRKTFDPAKGMKYEARLIIKAEGGTVTTKGNTIRVENADSAVFYYASATSYNGYLKEPGTEGVDPSPIVKGYLSKAYRKSYDELLKAHLADYQALFRRMWVKVSDSYTQKDVLGLQYARYEMIAVSRTGDRPHNQQGMWNTEWNAMSNCCHFLNENVEKYYVPAEPANIADCTQPLWNWIDELAERGAITAKIDWGFRGWMAPHYSDIWASTPLKGGNNEWSIWPMGGVWLCQNLWDHYAFSQDKEFLAKRAYPHMKGAAEFALDLLVKNEKGQLVTSPSSSPENQFRLVEGGTTYAVSQGSTMDIALVRELFENCIMATKILNVDADFRTELQTALSQMIPFQIGANGELQEWSKDFFKRDNGHRHLSQGLTVWPLRQITERNPALFKAAQTAMDNRGRGGYHPDKAAMYARMKQGDKALEWIGGSGHAINGQFPPLFAAMPEMLLFSHTLDSKGAFELELLPALPSSWKDGKVSGLRGRGAYDVEIEWANGELKKARIDSRTGTTPVIRYNGKELDPSSDSRITLNLLK